jgi:hypothetical protein
MTTALPAPPQNGFMTLTEPLASTEGNERLTALTAMVLLALLALDG